MVPSRPLFQSAACQSIRRYRLTRPPRTTASTTRTSTSPTSIPRSCRRTRWMFSRRTAAPSWACLSVPSLCRTTIRCQCLPRPSRTPPSQVSLDPAHSVADVPRPLSLQAFRRLRFRRDPGLRDPVVQGQAAADDPGLPQLGRQAAADDLLPLPGLQRQPAVQHQEASAEGAV
jgi:hypothetical protein